MSIETLNCPMCGAPTSSEAAQCEHCGARLAKVACPSCFGLIYQGAKFCSHCGAAVESSEVDQAKSAPCPRCRTVMKTVAVGPTAMQECPKCEGLWVDAATVEHIYAERERQVSVLQVVDPTLVPVGGVEDKVQYLPCPVCRKLMNRVNFAHYSNVVVDICKGHGTWFDRDELRRVIEFIRAGGLDQARTRELTDLNERQRQLSAEQRPTPCMSDSSDEDFHLNRHQGVSMLVDAVMDWLR